MASFFDELNDEVQAFIGEQKIFFTGTAPTEGRINVSPKGMDVFRIFDSKTVGYLDMTGSGNETAAHTRENGRMTIMFCGFTASPLILRLYGKGRSIRPGDPDWDRYFSSFESFPGQRQIILLEIESVQTSCGYAVPLFEWKEDRQTLVKWAENKGAEGLEEYRQTKNVRSIDGLVTGA